MFSWPDSKNTLTKKKKQKLKNTIQKNKKEKNSFQMEIIKEIDQTFNTCLLIRKKEGEGQNTVFIEREKWNDLKNEKNLYFNLDEDKIMFLK